MLLELSFGCLLFFGLVSLFVSSNCACGVLRDLFRALDEVTVVGEAGPRIKKQASGVDVTRESQDLGGQVGN